jgi:hypothetical protein
MAGYGDPGFLFNTAAQYATAPIPGQPLGGPNVARTGEMSYWSTYNLGAANTVFSTSPLSYFSTQLGQQGQGFSRNVTFAETNIREGSRIPSQFGYAVRALSAQPYACVPAASTANSCPVPLSDLLNLQHQTALQWDLNGTTIDIAPLASIGAGGGVFGGTADTGNSYGTNGSMVALNSGNGSVWVYQVDPILLSANQTFNLKQIAGADCAPVRLAGVSNSELRVRLSMYGLFARTVPQG